MGRTAFTEPQRLYKGALYLYLHTKWLWWAYPSSYSVGTGTCCPGSESDHFQLMWRLGRRGVVHPLYMPLWHAQRKNFCPFDGGVKYPQFWYESVALLGMQIGVKMELLINHVEVVALLQINPQLMYSTVMSVERSSWAKSDLSHTLSNMLAPHCSRCRLITLWFSSYLRNMYTVLLDRYTNQCTHLNCLY